VSVSLKVKPTAAATAGEATSSILEEEEFDVEIVGESTIKRTSRTPAAAAPMDYAQEKAWKIKQEEESLMRVEGTLPN
jgi:hypothetical protein